LYKGANAHSVNLTPKIPGVFLPISTSKMLIFKKIPKKIKNKKSFNPATL
jgi:hypothetical protein